MNIVNASRVVIVTGGRDFKSFRMVNYVLSATHTKEPISLLIHGACRGADLLCEDWAKSKEVPYLGVPAEWSTKKISGVSPGIARNKQIAHLCECAELIWFPGASGTSHMVAYCRNQGMTVTSALSLIPFGEEKSWLYT